MKELGTKESLAANALTELAATREDPDFERYKATFGKATGLTIDLLRYHETLGKGASGLAMLTVLEKRNSIKSAQALGTDVLVPEAARGRRLTDFSHGAKPLSLGLAGRTVSVGLYHPEAGMAGANKLFYEPKEVVSPSLAYISDKHYYIRAQLQDAAKAVTKDNHLLYLIQKTARESIHQFISVQQARELRDVRVIMYGGIQFQGNRVVEKLMINEILFQAMHFRIITGNDPLIVNQLGKKGQVIYGGPDHPDYPTPTFIPFTR